MKKKIIIFSMLFAILTFAITNCVQPPPKEIIPPDNLLKYIIINDTTSDTPFRTEVNLDVLITRNENEDITQERFRDLLNYLYDKTMIRTGFEYSKHPTVVHIYIYSSEYRAIIGGEKQWVAMIEKGQYADENDPDITIEEDKLNALIEGSEDIPPLERWGLTLEERIEVWNAHIYMNDEAVEQANEKYPLDDPDITIDDISKNNQYLIELNKKNKIKLADSVNVSVAIIGNIINEAFKYKWNVPERR